MKNLDRYEAKLYQKKVQGFPNTVSPNDTVEKQQGE